MPKRKRFFLIDIFPNTNTKKRKHKYLQTGKHNWSSAGIGEAQPVEAFALTLWCCWNCCWYWNRRKCNTAYVKYCVESPPVQVSPRPRKPEAPLCEWISVCSSPMLQRQLGFSGGPADILAIRIEPRHWKKTQSIFISRDYVNQSRHCNSRDFESPP